MDSGVGPLNRNFAPGSKVVAVLSPAVNGVRDCSAAVRGVEASAMARDVVIALVRAPVEAAARQRPVRQT